MEAEKAEAAPEVANKFAPTVEPRKPTRGHRALRRYRTSLPNRTYFITACTDERTRLFSDVEICALVFEHLHELEDSGHITLVASVVMPDHLHAVVTLHDDSIDKNDEAFPRTFSPSD